MDCRGFSHSVGFPRYIVCRLIVSVFCVFRAYILYSVVAERTIGSESQQEATNVNHVSSELLKWTKPHTRHWILIFIEQAIKQGFPNDSLMN